MGSGIGLWMYLNHDRADFIDDPVVEDAISAACTTMTDEVRAAVVPHDAAVAIRVAAIRRQNEAIWDFVDAVHKVGDQRLDGDLPSRAWLTDWKSILSLRERASVDLAAGGEASYAVPLVDGSPITRRMNDASSYDSDEQSVAVDPGGRRTADPHLHITSYLLEGKLPQSQC
ncbi:MULTISPECIES: hypothetical protein [unclassified Kribbella]|uniref:hypothetical protein n=1 Tax=unclassified Kribbella TaxID=2644121 RepID=UPI0030198BA8